MPTKVSNNETKPTRSRLFGRDEELLWFIVMKYFMGVSLLSNSILRKPSEKFDGFYLPVLASLFSLLSLADGPVLFA
jgi:hypothetical protein